MQKSLNADKLRSHMKSQGISQSDLVGMSRVSRATITRLFSKGITRTREATARRIADAVGLPLDALVDDGRLPSLRNWLVTENGFIDFRGFDVPLVQRQPIECVYVEPDVLEIEDPETECPRETPNGRKRWRRSDPPIGATECIRSQERVVILGPPGSGKTTLLRYLAHAEARRDDDGAELPIYIRLPEFSRAEEIDERTDPIKFVAALAAKGGCPNAESTMRKELADEKRRCFVLLDGLDEVAGDEQRTKLFQAVLRLIEEYPRNRFVITSRLVGFDHTPWTMCGFSVFRILRYSQKQLAEFVRKWAAILSRVNKSHPESEVLKSLNAAVFSNPRVRALAANPLILTILVLLNESRGGSLPRRRVDLYAKVVDVFLETWEASKRASEGFEETFNIEIDDREFRWLLSDLALAMQRAGRTLAPRWWLADRMEQYFQQKLGFSAHDARDASDRIIRYLTQRVGLIEETGLDLFGFSHRTLQEYFASLGVIDEADASARPVPDTLRGYYFHPQWSEVVRLVAAQLTPPAAETLLTGICDDPDPVGRFLKRGQLLLLRCLSDGTTVPNRQFVSGVFDALRELGQSRWLGVTLEAFDALENLEGTRWEQPARETIESILDTANQVLDPDEQLCLVARARFESIMEQAQKQLGDFDQRVARRVTVTTDGMTHPVAFINFDLRLKDAEAWYRGVCTLLNDEATDHQLKELVLREVGRQVATDPRSRRALRKILGSPAASSLRAACAHALAAGSRGRDDSTLLLRIVNSRDHAEVRSACAASLKAAAARDVSVRKNLLQLLRGSEPVDVRAGAARGLAEAAKDDGATTKALLDFANRMDETEMLRVACAWALEEQIGRDSAVTRAFESWLGATDAPRLQRVAAQVLAHAMGDDIVPWNSHVVERVEHFLMNLVDPCPHALASLESLATAREVRRGLRLENVLRECLKESPGKIEFAFVFGSTARSRQTKQSDIDLMLIGEIRLRDLSSPLRRAEKTLGRRINPVIYTREAFRQKYQSGDPFLTDVYRREKIPVAQASATPSRRELDDELRAMVAEHVAPTR